MTTAETQTRPELTAGRLDPGALQAEVAAARTFVVQPEHLLNSLAICRMIYDEDGHPCDWVHLYTNPAWEAQSGSGSAVGMYASDMFPGIHDLDREVLEAFTRVAAGGAPERFTRFLRSAGEWFAVQAYCPRVGYFVAVFDVVTERIKSTEALHDTQRRLSLAQSVSKSGFWDWDIPAGTLQWTPEMRQLFGQTVDGPPATFDTWRSVVHPDDLVDAETRINLAIQTRAPLFNEYRIVLPGGEQRWIRVHGNTLYDAAGAPARMLGFCVDVTEVKQLSEVAAQASAANTAKNMFVATMSHELRTPLNSIIGFTSLMLEGLSGPVSEEQARQLAIVKSSGQQLLDLVSEILDIAQVESGKLVLNVEPVPLLPALRDQVEALRPNLAGEVAMPEPVCDADVVVNVDRKRFNQVLRNVLSNAIKYTDRGEVRLSAKQVDDKVRIDIVDTGIGIAPDEIERLFMPFRRSDNPASARRSGTGLGLSIAQALVQAMGGSISVRSEPDRGSTFSVTVPGG